MTDDFSLISTNLDQPSPLKGYEDVFEKIDNIISMAINTGNGWGAISAVQELYQIARVSSISLAKMLHAIVTNWDKFNIEEDMFTILTESLGLHKYTITRYVEAWDTLQYKIPSNYGERLMDRGIRDVIIVSKLINSGYDLTEDQWENIIDAPDRVTMEDTIREIKQEPVSENKIYAQMELDGTIYVYHKGEKHFVGKLETSSGIFAVQKMIFRMCIGGGVSRK